MMIMKMKVSILTIIAVIVFSVSAAFPITIGKDGKGAEAISKKVLSAKIVKKNEFLIKIQNNILYTERNQYNLEGVDVVDRTKGKKVDAGKKRIVGLIFVNTKLKEIVIYP